MGCPRKWTQGLKPAAWWFNFDPYPPPLSLSLYLFLYIYIYIYIYGTPPPWCFASLHFSHFFQDLLYMLDKLQVQVLLARSAFPKLDRGSMDHEVGQMTARVQHLFSGEACRLLGGSVTSQKRNKRKATSPCLRDIFWRAVQQLLAEGAETQAQGFPSVIWHAVVLRWENQMHTCDCTTYIIYLYIYTHVTPIV